ncbi:hypothetical protein HKX48_003996 [Thoreauomyces humboldtii]|nr:hypothetical protein HKX48_003996 [Thoreauomyces humboldtii]
MSTRSARFSGSVSGVTGPRSFTTSRAVTAPIASSSTLTRQQQHYQARHRSAAAAPPRLPVLDKTPIVTKAGGGHQIMKQDGKTFWVSDEQYEYYKEAFNLFDRDKSGAIDLEELGAVMQSIGFQPSEEELMAMIDKVDADHTGTVEFDEFLQMSHEWMIQGRLETEDQIRDAFDSLDLDRRGYIDGDMLGRLLAMLLPDKVTTAEETLDMIREFDLDGDGVVGFDDFLGIMTEV